MRLDRILYVLLVVLCVPAVSFSQIQLKIDSFDTHVTEATVHSVPDGLSQTFVHDISQDSLGFIWLATRGGLNRYDGRNFVVFRRGTEFFAVDEFNDSTLIAGSEYGLLFLDLKKEAFRPHPEIDFQVNAIANLNDDTYLIGTDSGLVVLNANEATIGRQLNGQKVHTITVLDSLKGYLVTYSDSIGQFDLNHVRQQVVKVPAPIKKVTNICLHLNYAMASSEIGDLLVCRFKEAGSFNSIAKQDTNVSIWCTYVDSLQRVWAGLGNGIIECYEGKPSDETRIARVDIGVKERILCFFEDQDGTIWIGTEGSGVIKVLLREKSNFKPANRIYADTNRLRTSHEIIWSVGETPRGRILLGTEKGVWVLDSLFPGVDGEWLDEPDSTGLDRQTVLALAQGPNGRVWVGTDSSSIYEVIESDSNIYAKRYRKFPSLGPVKVILPSRSGDSLWVGTRRSGLYLVDLNTGKIDTILFDRNNFLRNRIYTLKWWDNPGSGQRDLLVGTLGGGMAIVSGGPQFRQDWLCFPNPESFDENCLSHPKVVGLYANRDSILIGTYGGSLNLYRPSLGKWSVISIPSYYVYCIVEDARGHFWMSTNYGLYRTNRQFTEFLHLGLAEGVHNLEFVGGADHYSKRYRSLFFGSIHGCYWIYEDSVRVKPREDFNPRIALTELRIGEKTVNPGDSTGILSESIAYTKRIEVKEGTSLLLRFAALAYGKTAEIRYRYSLSTGKEKRWIPIEDQNYWALGELEDGEYLLSIDAIDNENNSLSREGKYRELFIEVKPSFWNSFIGKGIIGLGVMLVTFVSFIFFNERRRRREERRKEETSRQNEKRIKDELQAAKTALETELKKEKEELATKEKSLNEKVSELSLEKSKLDQKDRELKREKEKLGQKDLELEQNYSWTNLLQEHSGTSTENLLRHALAHLNEEFGSGIASFWVPTIEGFREESVERDHLKLALKTIVIGNSPSSAEDSLLSKKLSNRSVYDLDECLLGEPIFSGFSDESPIVHKSLSEDQPYCWRMYESEIGQGGFVGLPIYKSPKEEGAGDHWNRIWGVIELRPIDVPDGEDLNVWEENLLAKARTLSPHIESLVNGRKINQIDKLKRRLGQLSFESERKFYSGLSPLVAEAMDAEQCSIFMPTEDRKDLYLVSSTASDFTHRVKGVDHIIKAKKYIEEKVKAYHINEKETPSITCKVFKANKTSTIYNVEESTETDRTFAEKFDTESRRSIIVAPIRDDNGNAIGVVRCVVKKKIDNTLLDDFTPSDIEFFELIVGIISPFIEYIDTLTRRDEFLQMQSHEIRVPLAQLNTMVGKTIGVASIALKERNGKMKRDLDQFRKQFSQEAMLLRSILDDVDFISDLQGEKAKYKFEMYSPAKLVTEVAEAYSSMAEHDRGISIKPRTRESKPFYLDKNKVRQIFINLLKNAVRYSHDRDFRSRMNDPTMKKDIEIYYSHVNEKIKGYKNKAWEQFEIQNWGIGIEEEDMERIFEKFKRGRNANRKSNSGTGIGLFLCREMMKAHGGVIEVHRCKNPTIIRLLFPSSLRVGPPKKNRE